MEIDEINCQILKTAGQTTPAAEIPFIDLIAFAEVFAAEVNTATATQRVAAWNASGRPATQVFGVLHAIIVTFGEGHRIWGRFHDYYSKNLDVVNGHLIAAFNSADRFAAQTSLRQIRGLGGEAYSTKVLRFISPNYVVCDSVLRQELCGDMPYEEFLEICQFIAQHLCESAVYVESSLYAYVQVAKPHQQKRRWKQYQERR